MISFSFEEANAILRLPVVKKFLERPYKVVSREFDAFGYNQDGSIMYIDRRLTPWNYLGENIDCKRFVLLRLHVEKSLMDALKYTSGIERQRLLLLMKMEDATDRAFDHCHAVATTCEEYKVCLSHGESGAKYYFEFLQSQKKLRGLVPEDLDRGGGNENLYAFGPSGANL